MLYGSGLFRLGLLVFFLVLLLFFLQLLFFFRPDEKEPAERKEERASMHRSESAKIQMAQKRRSACQKQAAEGKDCAPMERQGRSLSGRVMRSVYVLEPSP